MENSTNADSSTALFVCEHTIEPMAKRLADLIFPFDKTIDVNTFVALFNVDFKDKAAYDDLISIAKDDQINGSRLEETLNLLLSNVQNGYQALALYQRIEKLRESWMSYLINIKNLPPIIFSIEHELEISIKKSDFPDCNYQHALEGIPYLFGFCTKFFESLAVINKYFELLNDKVIKNTNDEVHQQKGSSAIEKYFEPTNSALPPFRIMIHSNALHDLYNVLIGYFNLKEHDDLLKRLKGETDEGSKLVFQSSGNRLADAFKQMYNAQLITGCLKKDLQRWIKRNFQYIAGKSRITKDFTDKYLESYISGNLSICKNPLFKVKQQDGCFKIEVELLSSKK